MKIQSIFRPHETWAGASLVLTLTFFSCTESKTKDLPTPIPPVPVKPVAGEEARSYGDYTELVWSDEFDSSALDQNKWGYDLGGGGWGNNELQAYTNSPDNVYLSGGNLIIKALKQQSGGNAYTSGRILTKGKKDFKYGRVDVRAKVPKGKGVWPAIWMLGSNVDQVNWPRCGEIDIMELRGSKPKELISTMHFPNSAGQRELRGFTKVLSKDLSDEFHVFSLVRSKSLLRFFLDGQEYYAFTGGDIVEYPFNNNFFAILNLAVGGQFDGDPDTTTTFPQQMEVDYVHFYQYK